MIYPYTTFLPIKAREIVSTHLPKKEDTPQKLPFEEAYYVVWLNGENTQETLLIVKDMDSHLWIPRSNLQEWHIKLPTSIAVITYNNVAYARLDDFKGAKYSIDTENMILKLVFPPGFFADNVINLRASQFHHFTPPNLGGFFNYNLYDTHTSTQGDQVKGLFEAGIFGKYGVVTTNYLASNARGSNPVIRLTTTWTYDDPDKMSSLRAGDVISRPTSWSGSVNYGGIQWATNFATQPNFITFPLPGYAGTAVVPSALDLYINGALANHSTIPTGPFNITNVPLVNGQGNIRIVTTDILGRQQVTNSIYYINTTLLNPGLVDYSYELGIVRQNLGVVSNDYSQLLTTATRRFGINDKTTLGVHGEALSYEQAVGIELTRIVSSIGVINSTLALSNNRELNNSKGGQVGIAFQHQTNSFSVGASSKIATLYFTQMGVAQGQLAPHLVNQLFAGIPLGNGSIGINYTKQITPHQPSTEIISGTYTRNIFKEMSLGFTVVDSIGSNKNKAAYLTLTCAMNSTTSMNYNGYAQTGVRRQDAFQIIHNLPPGTGYGYDATYTKGATETKEASLSYQNDVGTYTSQIVQTQGQETYNLGAAGGVVILDAHVILTRAVRNSFGIVETPGFSDMGIYVNNQLVNHTNKQGLALIPDLLAYQQTSVHIDPTTLPLDTEIDSTEIEVAPYYRSGVILPFKAKKIRSALFVLRQSSGDFIPEGAMVKLASSKEEFISGLNGEVYLTGLEDHNILHVLWDEHDCQIAFDLSPPKTNDPIPNLGEMVCREEKINENSTKKTGG